MLRIAIAGHNGRMGTMLREGLRNHPQCMLSGLSARAGHGSVGQQIDGVTVTDDVAALVAAADAVIDFTRPEYSLKVAQTVAAAGKVHIIGTTGFSAAEEATLAEAARTARMVKSGNMSLGVTLLARLVEQAARALGVEYDVEILEMHHRHKVDAPSGTALLLGEAAARGHDTALSEHAVHERHGQTGPRQPGDIGFAVLRGGDVIGDHRVILAGPGERLELSHLASNRMIYVQGALRAVQWAMTQPPGLYSMGDVLGV